MADPARFDASDLAIFTDGLFPVCPATHDQGLRWLFDLSTVLMLLDCRPGDRVLDLGAGSGFSSEMLARFGYTAVAVDPDWKALRNNRHRPSHDASRIEGRVLVSQGVAERLPFADASFDGVVCMNVLHHIPDLPLAAHELARVLKPGSRAVFCEPGLDHLAHNETQRARLEHGEDDHAFDVLAFLALALESGFRDAMLSATLQSPLRLLPLAEVELFRSGKHPRQHMNDAGVLEELHRRHPYGMLVRRGEKPRTSRNPGRLAHQLQVSAAPASVAAGGHVVVQATAMNTGDTRWLAAYSRFGSYVTFGCKLLGPDGRLVNDLLGRTRIAADVAPGAMTSATIDVEIPATLPPGAYTLRFDLVNELVCWFSDIGNTAIDRPITVSAV